MTRDSHEQQYRPDIDGLRAIAVLGVVAYHAFPRSLPGGFIGVDVFFVISGYLISGILFREIDRGGIELNDFYVRRIRRIFPALALVLMAVGALGWFVLTNTDFRDLQGHIAGGAGFVSNFLLWHEAGYFDAPARLKPLLHLWSLGIEEQFYLCWPPLLLLCARRKWRVSKVVIVLAAASFVLNCAIVRADQTAAFYSPFTRMWELFTGALIALPRGISQKSIVSKSAAQFAGWIGLVIVLTGMWALTDRLLYPGWWALVPTLGTALVIAAGDDAVSNRWILRRQPLVLVGLISYPLYLWHWPLLWFVEITEGGASSTRLKIEAIAVAAALALLTYKLVEQPTRRAISIRTPLRACGLAAAVLLIGSVALYGRESGRFVPQTPYLAAGIYTRIPSPRRDPECVRRFPVGSEYCHAFSTTGELTTALIGNSHAAHFLDGVGGYLATKGENVVHLGQGHCPPLLDLQRFVNGTLDVCRGPDNAMIAAVAADSQISRVILSFNGAVTATGIGLLGGYETDELAGTLLSPQDSLRLSLERTIKIFVDRGKVVWLLLQVPEMNFSVTECFARPFSFERRVRTPCAVPRQGVEQRQAPYRAIVHDVQTVAPDLRVFDPLPYLCDEQWCYATRRGDLLYLDDNHLSPSGSALFADKFSF